MKQTMSMTYTSASSPSIGEVRRGRGEEGDIEFVLLTPTTPNPSYTRRGIKKKLGKSHTSHFPSLLLIFLLSIPLIVSAQAPNPEPVNTVLTNFLALLTVVIKILISLAFVVFGWGIVKLIFTTRAGDAQKVGQAKQILLWGIIGIFVLASLSGIIIFLKTYFGIPNNTPLQPPAFTVFSTSFVRV